MKLKIFTTGCVFILLITLVVPAVAEQHEMEPGAYARNLAFVGGRAEQLSEAIPEDKYGWRPMEGVRSVSEAIMHMASANYFFASRLGATVPEGVDTKNMDKITDKKECLEALKASNEFLAKAFDGVEDPLAAMDIFGRDATTEDMMLIAIGHVHEHFGQLIAYARANEVVPPWSKGEG